MAKVFLNLVWKEGTPTPEEVIECLGIEPESLDRDFGVIEIDPEEHLFTILVEQSTAAELSEAFKDAKGVEGPYSDPRIEPFDLRGDE